MKKKFSAILLSICMILALMPATAFADTDQITISYEYSYGTLSEDRQAQEKVTDGEYFLIPDLEDCGPREFLGWQIKNSDDIDLYAPGDEYAPSKDMTFFAVYADYVTLNVPFTTTVKQGGEAAPGKADFSLEIVDAWGNVLAGSDDLSDVDVTASISTDGVGIYKGTMSITGPYSQLRRMLIEGAFVKQVNAGEKGWTYDDKVWGLLLSDAAALSLDDQLPEYVLSILPVLYGEKGKLTLDYNSNPLNEMSFTNVYTASGDESEVPGDPEVPGDSGDPGDSEGPTVPDDDSTEYTETVTNNDVTDSPDTGDNSSTALWIVLFAVSAAGVVDTGVYSRRKRNSQVK